MMVEFQASMKITSETSYVFKLYGVPLNLNFH